MMELQLRQKDEKGAKQKNIFRKTTYPPPADGLYVLFLCKSGCSANDPAAQAGRGASQQRGRFTMCKVLKRNAVRLHRGVGSGSGGGALKCPV